jgi:hypothetical protein
MSPAVPVPPQGSGVVKISIFPQPGRNKLRGTSVAVWLQRLIPIVVTARLDRAIQQARASI